MTKKTKDTKSRAAKGATSQRIFLVMVDETEEMRVALHYAALRARHTGGRVALLFVIEPSEFRIWGGIEALQRQESRAAAEAVLENLSAEVNEISGSMPVVHIREGRRGPELLALLDEEPSISVLVMAAGTGPVGPGSLMTALIGKMAGAVRVPVTVVPGNLTPAQLAALA